MAKSLSSVVHTGAPTAINGLDLANAKASIQSNGFAEKGPVAVGATQNTWYTIVSAAAGTGPGIIHFLSIYLAGVPTTGRLYEFRFTVDGTVLLTSDAGFWNDLDGTDDGQILVGVGSDNWQGGIPAILPFADSFSVEARCTSHSTAINFNYQALYTTG